MDFLGQFITLLLEVIVKCLPLFAIPALILFILSGFFINDNKKNFKYIFKISKTSGTVDILQIFIILVLFLFAVLLIVPSGSLIVASEHHSCSPCMGECRSALKRSLSYVNQAVSLEKELEGKVSYDNANDFGLMLTKRLSLTEIYNVENVDIKNSDKIKTFTKREIKKYNLSEYQNNPILVVADGSVFMISKFEKGCKKADLDNPDNCSCLIDVDLNGIDRKPDNKKDFDPKRQRNDRYTFVIYGNEDKVLPLRIYHSMIFDNISGAGNGRK